MTKIIRVEAIESLSFSINDSFIRSKNCLESIYENKLLSSPYTSTISYHPYGNVVFTTNTSTVTYTSTSANSGVFANQYALTFTSN